MNEFLEYILLFSIHKWNLIIKAIIKRVTKLIYQRNKNQYNLHNDKIINQNLDQLIHDNSVLQKYRYLIDENGVGFVKKSLKNFILWKNN